MDNVIVLAFWCLSVFYLCRGIKETVSECVVHDSY